MKTFFNALTGFRAIAAWMIFFYHFFPYNNPSIPKIFKNFVGSFHIGVDMFFVLSGFLIAYRYYDQSPVNFKKYFINRFSRIYPMFFLITFLYYFKKFFILSNPFSTDSLKEVLLNFSLTKALFNDYFYSGVPQAWTLTIEEIFYISAPIFFLLIKKSKIYLYLIPIFILIFGTSLNFLFINNHNIGGFMHHNISLFIVEFFVGIILAFLIKNNQKTTKKGFLTYFGALFIITFLFVGKPIIHSFFEESNTSKFLEIITLSVLGILPFYYGLIYEKTGLQKILGSNFFVLLGKSSYLFYLIHLGVISNFIFYFITENKILIFILLNIISVAMFYFLEEPINKYIRRKLS